MTVRTIASFGVALAAFAGFAYLGVAEDAYGLSFVRGNHDVTIFLRKAYSILAFAALGYIFCARLRPSGKQLGTAGAALAVAGCSASIEVLQYVHGAREGLLWNAFDVICGAAGGALGAIVARALEVERPGYGGKR